MSVKKRFVKKPVLDNRKYQEALSDPPSSLEGKYQQNSLPLRSSFFMGSCIYQAIMVEFTLDPDSDFPLKISTGPFVFPDSYPYEKYEPIK